MTFWSFFFSTKTVVELLLNSELIIILLFFVFLNAAVYFNLNTLFGLAYLFLILGGLELALSILLLLI